MSKKKQKEKRKTQNRGNRPRVTINSILKRWPYLLSLLVGLIPFIFTSTPVHDLLHPITINPSTIQPLSIGTINYFNITNNRNTTLYSIQIEVSLPEGLTSDHIKIDKLSRTDDVEVEIPAEGGSIIWNTSVTLIHGYDEKHSFILILMDKILPGESNIVSFSMDVAPSDVKEVIKLSTKAYSSKPSGIIYGSD